jgi:glycosyltransferase involved in cell wall biosynthesis
MVIAFIHAYTSFLPELKAYQQFFAERNIDCITINSKDAPHVKTDVLWHIMGFAPTRRKDVITIHEYTSASAPPYAELKNAAKRMLNAKPDFRLFLNAYVRKKTAPEDGIPFGYRDMGVDFTLFKPSPGDRETKYDFIYLGNLHYTRGIGQLLQNFTSGSLRERNLLVLGKEYGQLASAYARFPNIRFVGPVDAGEVSQYINQSTFAINYIPDIEPYNQQTSTKLLEYAACRTPIISTSYSWIRKFQRSYGGDYFFLEPDLSNFTWEAVNGFRYDFPEISDWSWERQIVNSGVLQFLQENFPATRISG